MRFFLASGCPIATTTLYRCVHLAEQLRALGHETEIVDWFNETQMDPTRAAGYDAIFLYRLPMSPPLAQVIETAHQTGTPIIFDTDDLIFEPDLVHAQRGVARLSPCDQEEHTVGVRRYLQTLLACDAVTTATPLLAELVTRRGQRAFVHRNALGQDMLTLANRLRQRLTNKIADKAVIGYGSGTPTHDVDFAEATSALCTILQQFPNTELWIAGPVAIAGELETFGERVRRFPLTNWPGWFERASQFDIALAPLELENVFCRAKSEIKFIEAAALGVPVVASRTEPYESVITAREDGLLATDERDWVQALSWLIKDPHRRAEMGERARQKVQQRYTPAVRTAELAEMLPQLLATKSR